MNELVVKILGDFAHEVGNAKWMKLSDNDKGAIERAIRSLATLTIRLIAGEDVKKEINFVKATLENYAIGLGINCGTTALGITSNLLKTASSALIKMI